MNLDQGLLKLMSSPAFQMGVGLLGRNDMSLGQALGGTMQDMQRYQVVNQEMQRRQAEQEAQQVQQQYYNQWLGTLPQEQQMQFRAMPQLGMKYMENQILPRKPTDDIQEYQQAVAQGFPGSFMDYMTHLRTAGATKIDIGDKTGGLDFKNESALRSEYLNSTKDYWPVRDSFERVQASIEDPSAAGDMALIFNYMKMLDPGSTVREGEFATAQNSGSIDRRIVALYNNIRSGQRFTPEQRQDFADRAQKLFQKQHNKFGITNKYYSGLARSYNFDPSRIIRDMGPLSIERQQEAQEQKEPDEVRVINGVTYHRYGKDWMQE